MELHCISRRVSALGTIGCFQPSLTYSSIVYKLPGVCREKWGVMRLTILLTVFRYK